MIDLLTSSRRKYFSGDTFFAWTRLFRGRGTRRTPLFREANFFVHGDRGRGGVARVGRLGEHMGEGASIEGAGGTAARRAPKKYKIRVRGVVCVMVHRRAQRVR